MPKKEAKFFCQCCGAEVPPKAKFCPKCGKFFASVLCPNCGHTGQTRDFINGCPECGYAVDGSHGGKSFSGKKSAARKTKNIRLKKNHLYLPLNSRKSTKAADSSLPVWVYVLCLLVLFGLVSVLYSCL